MPGGPSRERDRDRERNKDRGADRSRDWDRRYREQKSNRDYQFRRSPDYPSSDDDNYGPNRHVRSNHGGSLERGRRSDRDYSRDRSRSRSKERNRGLSGNCGETEYDYHEPETEREKRFNKYEEVPNSTIMIRGLPPHIIENDIITKLSEQGLVAKDIRLMRKKDTGASRGFAFVEFASLSEAVRWKDMNQGAIVFDDTKAILHYSIPKEADRNSDRNPIQKYDWTCYKCGVNNFKRRDVCFKCGTTREESAANESGDEVSINPTNCLLFRNLAAHTTEDKILAILGTFTTLPIKSIRIPRDSLYGVSRSICFVELHTTLEASQLYTLLSSLSTNFIVDDYPLTVCYAKRNLSGTHATPGAINAASVALAAAQWTNQSEPSTNTGSNNPYSSSNEHFQSLPSSQNDSSNRNSDGIRYDDSVNAGTVSVNGVIYHKYSPPDTKTYQYDAASGYYYDAKTGLYYDANSHYYYNPTTQTYLYWSEEHQTYLPASSIQDVNAEKSSIKNDKDTSKLVSKVIEQPSRPKEITREKEKPEKPEKLEKQDKVMIAKKIAKDMEKWAKTLNQKKESARNMASIFNADDADGDVSPPSSSCNPHTSKPPASDSSSAKSSEKKSLESSPKLEHVPESNQPDSEDSGSRSPSHDSQSFLQLEELRLTDWAKLLCLLCKRQFMSRDQLVKHQQASELHKANLSKLAKGRFGDSGRSDAELSYRDRARERRLKYGQPEKPEAPNPKFRDINVVPTPTPNKEPVPQENIGSKMLKAMGWSEGEGLGRGGKGRASVIEVQRRPGHAGLGMKTTAAGAEESYKDAVKRAMRQRFEELSKKEPT